MKKINFLILIIIKVCNSQINGDFWWLNDQISGIHSIKPENPQFEVISEFANDENDKIIFKDDNIFKNEFDKKHRDIESTSIYDSENVPENTTKINVEDFEVRQLANTKKNYTTAGPNNLESSQIIKGNKKGMNPDNQTKANKKGIRFPNSNYVEVSTNRTRVDGTLFPNLNSVEVSTNRTKVDGTLIPNSNSDDVSTNRTKVDGTPIPNSNSVDVSTNRSRNIRKEMHIQNFNSAVSTDRTKDVKVIAFPNFNANYISTNSTRNDKKDIVFPKNSAEDTIKPGPKRNFDLRNGLSFGLVEDSRKDRARPNTVRQNIGGTIQTGGRGPANSYLSFIPTDSKKVDKVNLIDCAQLDGRDKGASNNCGEDNRHRIPFKNIDRFAKIIFPDSLKRNVTKFVHSVDEFKAPSTNGKNNQDDSFVHSADEFKTPSTNWKYNQNDRRFVRSAEVFKTPSTSRNGNLALNTTPSSVLWRKLVKYSSPRRHLWQGIRTLNKLTPSSGKRGIVTEDEDPYWNIKNVFSVSNFSRRNTKISTGYSDDYDYDLTAEVPRPATQDEYADETPKPMKFNWADFNRNIGQGNRNVFGHDEPFYYGSPVLNPRYDHVAASTSPGVRPTPKPTESDEIIDEESEYSSLYSSHREYQVFEDFKLPKLFGKRNRTRSTTEKPADYDSLESVAILPSVLRPEDGQAWPKCGEVEDEGDYAEARKELVFGSRPWLILVTRSNGDGKTLCTATLVHLRAALTAASCVHGAVKGEVSVQAGGWDLGSAAGPTSTQQRRAAVRTHRGYRPGELGNDLAILYWDTALKECASVRPACLTDPADGDTCNFVGWGGADKNVFHRRPTEQRALVLSAQACASHLRHVTGSSRVPRGVFCATVLTSGCAAGAGGALVCGAGSGRRAVAGVASWRRSCDVTSPLVLTASREWALQTLRDLGVI